MSTVYIGIGSNLGDRQKTLDSAMDKLSAKKGIEIMALSSIIETDSIGNPDHPKFLNAACKIETTLYPDELLDNLKSVERELGRKKDSSSNRLSPEQQLKMLQEGKLSMAEVTNQPQEETALSEHKARRFLEPKARETGADKDQWAPREIDLDILFYDDIVVKGNNLIIPHPLLHERLFVLKPLSEIAPELMHPLLKKSVKDLFDEQNLGFQGPATEEEAETPKQETNEPAQTEETEVAHQETTEPSHEDDKTLIKEKPAPPIHENSLESDISGENSQIT